MSIRRIVQRLDPRLTDILNRLDESSIGPAFTDRVVELASSAAVADVVDHRGALEAHLWLLERAVADGLPLTAAGYLKPVTVSAFATVLPTMREWLFSTTRESDAHPVLFFREYLMKIRLLRKFKGTLRATKVASAGVAEPGLLWQHLATTLVPTASDFIASAGVVVLVHMATTDGRIDVDAVARTLSELGWSHAQGDEVGRGDVYPVWNDLWAALGNVGPWAAGPGPLDRQLSPEAIALICDALFTEVEESPGG